MATPKTRRYQPNLASFAPSNFARKPLIADLFAGTTVAVVALPLSMAIAIASGLGPDQGLIAAIVGGFLVSALGGSRLQIGGPAGAFIVLVAACVHEQGLDGLLLATGLSGLCLVVLGWLGAGRFVQFVPYPVTLGFTAGIGATILISQLRPLLGEVLSGPEPGPLPAKLAALVEAAGTINVAALGLGLGTLAMVQILRRWRPLWPGMLIAVALAAVIARVLQLPIETIGSAFPEMGHTLPVPHLPRFDLALLIAVLPHVVAFTLLGAIESLLSASVADSMSGDRHRPDSELIGQGLANVASAVFGGMPVTGTIARTATNVRAGAASALSGMVHSVLLLGFLILALDLARAIPLTALAGVLIGVALHMFDLRAMRDLLLAARAEAAVVIVTLGLTIFRDLTEGIIAGTALSALIFAHRMAGHTRIAPERSENGEDELVLRVEGSLFFGSAPMVEHAMGLAGAHPKRLCLDLSAAGAIDSSGVDVLKRVVARAQREGCIVRVIGPAALQKRLGV